MPLSFATKSQQFVFVDTSVNPHVTVDPEAAHGDVTYDIFVVLQNTDDFEVENVQVNVFHSAFGIGYMAGTVDIVQPLPVTVPPQAYGIPGTATVKFTFHTPGGGHGCLYAQIAPNGASVSQNVTVTDCPIGKPATFSFLVFGGLAPEAMVLTVTESVVGGAAIPANSPQSWKPLLVAPPGVGPTAPAPSPMTLNLPAKAHLSAGLQVSAPAGSTTSHAFRVVGTVGGVFVGQVDFILAPKQNFVAPQPYVAGGYQSADILMYDMAGKLIPLGGPPTKWNTLLQPDTPYRLAAVVHNDASAPAVNTVVRFWQFPGGHGTNGTLLDVRTVTVPAFGSVTVDCNAPFQSAHAEQHTCAAVSIYNAQSTNATVDYTTASAVADPTAHMSESTTAWRNSDSQYVRAGQIWKLILEGSLGAQLKVPTRVEVKTTFAAAGLEATPEAANLRKTLQLAGAKPTLPAYLVPVLRDRLPVVDLKTQVTPIKSDTAAVNGVTITGTIPADAKPGDRYLVLATAHYDNRAVEFLHTLYVKAE